MSLLIVKNLILLHSEFWLAKMSDSFLLFSLLVAVTWHNILGDHPTPKTPPRLKGPANRQIQAECIFQISTNLDFYTAHFQRLEIEAHFSPKKRVIIESLKKSV